MIKNCVFMVKRPIQLAFISFVVFIFFLCFTPHAFSIVGKDSKNRERHRAEAILIKFRKGHLKTKEERGQFYKKYAIKMVDHLPFIGVFKVVSTKKNRSIEKLLELLKKDPQVEYAELDSIVTIQ